MGCCRPPRKRRAQRRRAELKNARRERSKRDEPRSSPVAGKRPKAGKLDEQFETRCHAEAALGDFVTLISKQSLDSSQFDGRVAEDSASCLKESRAVEERARAMVAHSDTRGRRRAWTDGRRPRELAAADAGAGADRHRWSSVALRPGGGPPAGRQLGGEPGYAADVTARIAERRPRRSRVEARSGDDGQPAACDQAHARPASPRWWASSTAPTPSRRPRARSRRATRTCLRAPSNKPARSKQTAASMEELTCTVKQNADNARQANQLARLGLRSGGQGRRGREPGGRHHGLDQRLVEEDRRHHRRDRRHRVPDQHPRAQRGGGSGARRRAGPRLRGRGRRSAQPRAALGRSGQGNQGPDRRLGRQGRGRQRSWSARPARPWKRSSAA